LQTPLFNKHQLPAIDTGLSVSRIGSKAQRPLIKKYSKKIKIMLNEYYDNIVLSQFGSDLSSSTKKIIDLGKKILILLKQAAHNVYSYHKQVSLLFIIHNELVNNIPLNKFDDFFIEYGNWCKENKVFNFIEENDKLSEKQENELLNKVKKFCDSFSV